MNKWIILAVLAAIASPAHAKQRTVIEALPQEIVDNNHIVAVEVVIADTAQEKLQVLEAKAAGKRAAAGLAEYDPASSTERLGKQSYDTLPFSVMFPLVIQDVTRESGLTPDKGTPVKLRITLESIKTADAGMAILISSSDQLAGTVDVLDAQGTQQLGSFYVHVVNTHSGWGGMLMRGDGIREKLAEEFALESARVLTGSSRKSRKKDNAAKSAAINTPAVAQ